MERRKAEVEPTLTKVIVGCQLGFVEIVQDGNLDHALVCLLTLLYTSQDTLDPSLYELHDLDPRPTKRASLVDLTERERERESASVCVCVCERERG